VAERGESRSADGGERERRASWDREYAGPHPKWKGPPRDPALDLGGRVLELGCGNGKTAAALARRAEHLVALDFSLRGLEACRSAVPWSHVDIILGDVRRLPLADRSFDGVVAFHVLGHLLEDERREAAKEMFRVLAPGGTLMVRAFSTRDMRFGQGHEVEAGTFRRGTGIITHFFEKDEVRRLAAGLLEVSLEEAVAVKRYGGEERARAEWNGAFMKGADQPGP
jgi:SAM-dependent methyltransferase